MKKSSELNSSGAVATRFFLAMAHWQKGDKNQGRQWYDRAVDSMAKNNPQDEELFRFRAEAAALLGVSKDPKSTGKKEDNPTPPSKP